MIYQRKTNYHETDKMGVIHHANYIKWLEESRIEYLNIAGVPYYKMEEEGYLSPVVSLECKYVNSMYFNEIAYIDVKMTVYNGVKIEFEYTIKNQKDEICFTGSSKHCLVNKSGQIVSLKREKPDWHLLLQEALNASI